MATSSIPVSLEGLGMERDLDTPFFAHSEKKESSHGEVVSHLNSKAGSNLELPLRRHNFSVDARDLDASIQAGSVVGLYGITGEHLAGSYIAQAIADNMISMLLGQFVRQTGVQKATPYRHRSSMDPGDLGNRPLASRMVRHRC